MVDACAVATALGFAAAKLWAPATHACEWMLGALQWPLAHTGPIVPAWMVRDPTDLVALPMVALARWCFAADHARQNIVPVRLAASLNASRAAPTLRALSTVASADHSVGQRGGTRERRDEDADDGDADDERGDIAALDQLATGYDGRSGLRICRSLHGRWIREARRELGRVRPVARSVLLPLARRGAVARVFRAVLARRHHLLAGLRAHRSAAATLRAATRGGRTLADLPAARLALADALARVPADTSIVALLHGHAERWPTGGRPALGDRRGGRRRCGGAAAAEPEEPDHAEDCDQVQR